MRLISAISASAVVYNLIFYKETLAFSVWVPVVDDFCHPQSAHPPLDHPSSAYPPPLNPYYLYWNHFHQYSLDHLPHSLFDYYHHFCIVSLVVISYSLVFDAIVISINPVCIP